MRIGDTTITPGTRLGPSQIIGLAGSGGMGEGYRARDTRLDRTVALKVLPAHYDVSSDGQRFLVNSRRLEDAALPIHVVVGWAPEKR